MDTDKAIQELMDALYIESEPDKPIVTVMTTLGPVRLL